MKPVPIPELLNAIDELILARATGQNDKKALEAVIKARRNVGDTVATVDQLLAVLERQVEACFAPVINERRLCELLHCSRNWLMYERRAGRWLNFEVDARGARYYTQEQILANLRDERPRAKKAA
jgi:hypothetical protein